MPFAALIYVETLTRVEGVSLTMKAVREPQPRGARYVFGSAFGSSPTRDAIARKLHRELALAPNQRVAFQQTDRAILKRIEKVREKEKLKGQEMPWLDAYLLVKSRLRGRRHRQVSGT